MGNHPGLPGQLLVVLIIGILGLRTNEGGIEQENEANFRPAAKGVGRGAWGVGQENRCRGPLGASHVSRAPK